MLLVERYGFCGGGAVAGLSGTICGLYAAHEREDAAPEKLVHGLVDEFIERMEGLGGLGPPVRYGQTFTRVHDPLAWRQVADGLLADAGVEVLLHALVTDVWHQGECLEGARLYTKQGKVDVRARFVIDASGDADVVAMAGLDTRFGDERKVQNPTMMFRMMGVDVARFLAAHGPDSILGADIADLIGADDGHPDPLPRREIFLFPTPRQGELLCNATRVVGRDGRERSPLSARDLTEAEQEGRRQVQAYARFIRRHLSGCENAVVNDTGVQVGIRQSRQIRGVATLTNADVAGAVKNACGIARSPWPIELHSGARPKLVWTHDDFYEIPYECFVPVVGERLLVAGRCLSAEHEAMASARLTEQCFPYGQAIGLAASLSLEENTPARALSGREIRQQLNRLGAQLG
ncbi:FAD-dependent oxidoreductase [Azohydromonas sediminis]|uniref:FAD-dependent oxidoreductase n=1 Tax=Azohydromonas sediminis TaxID=2259674 RepID=UPI001F224939|nr:FAD-dependent oxidoreductase [Azohydromonas sediminis]